MSDRFMQQSHIDYVFGAKKFAERTKKIEVGQSENWLKLSDHMPIICEIEQTK
ncbi:MAG: hypothetical protein H6577_01575 [Lewinellaceae bacterium]|nr:hypothetical protein [Saprospiraceae bacterium]MCB9336796.1 hypothetical protein [Lewinellaceae bacterium]